MNKQELVEHVAGELDISKAKAADAIDAVLDGITKAVKKGDEVRLVGFGTFSVKKRAAGKGRNPATGATIVPIYATPRSESRYSAACRFGRASAQWTSAARPPSLRP